MTGILMGRVAVVTGAGRGIGRAHALELARQGAMVVVNDLGGGVNGQGQSDDPAAEVVDAIVAQGGAAVANHDDVSDWHGAGRLIGTALDTFGGLDILVNNAGILRDRMLTNMTIEDWDDVVRVHLRGTFAPTRWAAGHWRDRHKAGLINDARIINTSSSSGIYGNIGQANYGAAKAGIAAFTVIASQELGRYGVTVNALSPGARTRMTEELMRGRIDEVEPGAFDPTDPENIAPLVAWLASPEAAEVTGRVFNVFGGMISVAEGWHAGPSADNGGRWNPALMGPAVLDLVRRAAPNAGMDGQYPTGGKG